MTPCGSYLVAPRKRMGWSRSNAVSRPYLVLDGNGRSFLNREYAQKSTSWMKYDRFDDLKKGSSRMNSIGMFRVDVPSGHAGGAAGAR